MSTSVNHLPFCVLTKAASLLTATKMHLVHFILLVLLGLLAPFAASAPGQMVDAATEDLDRTVGNQLSAPQSFPENILVKWELKCALDPDNTEKAPNSKSKYGTKDGFLKDSWCRRYYKCASDGKELWDAICVH